MDTKKIKSCPFCGSEVKAEVMVQEDPYKFYSRILFFKCLNKECGAIVSFNNEKTYKSHMKAIENWDRRANDDEGKNT